MVKCRTVPRTCQRWPALLLDLSPQESISNSETRRICGGTSKQREKNTWTDWGNCLCRNQARWDRKEPETNNSDGYRISELGVTKDMLTSRLPSSSCTRYASAQHQTENIS